MASSDVVTDKLWLPNTCICGTAGFQDGTVNPAVAPTYEQMMRIRRHCLTAPISSYVTGVYVHTDLSGGGGYALDDLVEVQGVDGRQVVLLWVTSEDSGIVLTVSIDNAPSVPVSVRPIPLVFPPGSSETVALYNKTSGYAVTGVGLMVDLTWSDAAGSGCCDCG